MKCPECGDGNAYMGFSSIDCPNLSCRHYQGAPEPAPAPAPAPAPVPSTTSRATAATPSPAQSQGSTGTATAPAPSLAIDIISQVPKKSTIEITFTARGDPGYPNKTVEFFWTLPNQPGAVASGVICTLSSRNTYYVAGVDADGTTVYTTQWRCTLDGVQPTDQFTLSWKIH